RLDASAQGEEFSPDAIEAFGTVAQRRGVLELEPLRRPHHSLAEHRERRVGAPLQELAGKVDAGVVLALRAAAGARRQAAADFTTIAEGRGLEPEQLELVGEAHSRRRAAVPELEEIGQLADRLPHPRASAEGAVVQRSVVGDFADEQEPRRLLARALDEAVMPFPLLIDVVDMNTVLGMTHLSVDA